MSGLSITMGADPEMMLMDLDAGKIVNAIPVIGHDKHNPVNLGDEIKMYSDNVLVEFAFPACYTKAGFVTKIGHAIRRMHRYLGDRYRLVPQAAHVYDEDQLGKKPEVMTGALPEAWEIGCNPNYDVYARRMRTPAPFSNGLRTGSFHVHVGNSNYRMDDETMLKDVKTKEQAIRIMDIFVGCASVIFDRDETSLARRELYGKAGEFRPTKYGVEYRCLGNYVLRSPRLVGLVYDLTDFAMQFMGLDRAGVVLENIDPDTVIKAINTNDQGLAAAVLAEAGLSDSLWERVQEEYNPDFISEWDINNKSMT